LGGRERVGLDIADGSRSQP